MCDELRVQLVVLVASRVKAHGQTGTGGSSDGAAATVEHGQPVSARDESEVDTK